MPGVTDEDADEQQVPTVRERLTGRLSPERIDLHLRAGRILLGGQPVTDLDMPAPRDVALVISRA